MKLALIDADGLCYHSLRETLEDSLTALDEKIKIYLRRLNVLIIVCLLVKVNILGIL